MTRPARGRPCWSGLLACRLRRCRGRRGRRQSADRWCRSRTTPAAIRARSIIVPAFRLTRILAREDALDLLDVDRFVLEQGRSHRMQLVEIADNDALGRRVVGFDDLAQDRKSTRLNTSY